MLPPLSGLASGDRPGLLHEIDHIDRAHHEPDKWRLLGLFQDADRRVDGRHFHFLRIFVEIQARPWKIPAGEQEGMGTAGARKIGGHIGLDLRQLGGIKSAALDQGGIAAGQCPIGQDERRQARLVGDIGIFVGGDVLPGRPGVIHHLDDIDGFPEHIGTGISLMWARWTGKPASLPTSSASLSEFT